LRVTESDRITTMAAGLAALGAEVETAQDGLRVRGGRLSPGTVDSRGDHRVAMSFAIAAARAGGPVRILDVAGVGTSFPGFAQAAGCIGLAQFEEI
jgi:3-phosphoshikimate 1-carboxyvinyltransferase